MPPTDLLTKLRSTQRRGSKPRCHLLTHGDDVEVAARLNALVSPWGHISPEHVWYPRGFKDTTEAQLSKVPELLSDEYRKAVTEWWLEVRRNATTPNWDIASTCIIQDKPGLILVEAKAHSNELSKEGKANSKSENGWKNHKRIGQAIAEANTGLNHLLGCWDLSRDKHYQLCSRFAWSWKLASLGVPVILVYLGFLNADEMADCGEPFRLADQWESAVREHGTGVVPDKAWDRVLDIGGTPLIPLIRSRPVDLPLAPSSGLLV